MGGGIRGYAWWCNNAVVILWTNQRLQCIHTGKNRAALIGVIAEKRSFFSVKCQEHRLSGKRRFRQGLWLTWCVKHQCNWRASAMIKRTDQSLEWRRRWITAHSCRELKRLESSWSPHHQAMFRKTGWVTNVRWRFEFSVSDGGGLP